jgi:glycosyltransferase involved in cell wall biosynthesis
MKLSVVVPFYNELRTLPTVIDRLLAVDFGALNLETELIFVDDGSTDAGRSLLDPLPRGDVRLIVHPENRGKGPRSRPAWRRPPATSSASRTPTSSTTPATCRP